MTHSPTPLVTLVVVPRERFSCAQASLESIYAHTEGPFNLVYVDGNSPAKVRHYLQEQSVKRGFKLVRTNHYLHPNQARNLGLQQVETPYLVFIDNDVIVSPGWLTALLQCAEDTQATVVGPLMCERQPLHHIVHFAGGESRVVTDIYGRRHLREKMYKQKKLVKDVHPQLQRTPSELAEFHCVLVRRSIFDTIGPLDEAMYNTKEHLDFCMTVANAGGTVYFEPASIVTYVPGPPLELGDLHYYMLRWSDEWTLNSLRHLREKWNLHEDGYFKSKYKKLGWRREQTIVKPISQRLLLGRGQTRLRHLLAKLDRRLNRYLTGQYAQRQTRSSP
ncbi:MAG TPA: glycosyltransferase [Candidatus Obscuribacterales bacterium]